MTGTINRPTSMLERATSFEGLISDGAHLYWVESRPDGRSAVMAWSSSAPAEELAVGAGNGVHAYGGGVVAPSPWGTWWVSADEGQVWLQGERITDGPAQYGDLRFAEGLL